MSRRSSVPSYGLHKASGQARIVVAGQTIYLGKYGSPSSHERYAREIARLAAAPEQAELSPVKLSQAVGVELTINELLIRFLHWADQYFRFKGERTKEYRSYVEALRLLRELYGSTAACDFGPKALKLLQSASIKKGWCRRTINARINRIRRVFKWGVSEELISPSVYHGLSTVAGLQYGRTAARESEPTETVAQRDIDAVLPYVAPQVAAMIQAQLFGAMRPAEVTIMRPCDIDRTDPELWIYRPDTYKTKWLERSREIFIGPRCQAVLKPFLDRPAEAYMFSPIEAERQRNESRAEHRNPDRKTTVYPSELRQREKRKKAAASRRSLRPKGEHYSVDSYRRAVEYGITEARRHGIDVITWSPRRLRHTMATKVRDELGLEAAQVVLGHARADVTQVYAQRNRSLGLKVARQVG